MAERISRLHVPEVAKPRRFTVYGPIHLHNEAEAVAAKMGITENSFYAACIGLRMSLAVVQSQEKERGNGGNISIGQRTIGGKLLEQYDTQYKAHYSMSLPVAEYEALAKKAKESGETLSHYVNKATAFGIQLFASAGVEKKLKTHAIEDLVVGQRNLVVIFHSAPAMSAA